MQAHEVPKTEAQRGIQEKKEKCKSCSWEGSTSSELGAAWQGSSSADKRLGGSVAASWA